MTVLVFGIRNDDLDDIVAQLTSLFDMQWSHALGDSAWGQADDIEFGLSAYHDIPLTYPYYLTVSSLTPAKRIETDLADMVEKLQHGELRVGQSGSEEIQVHAANTARAMGSGDLDVFATPAMIALMEAAAVDAVRGSLPPEQTTVGIQLDISHTAPSVVGESVRAEAEVVALKKQRITFLVTASSASKSIGQGRHVRAIVDRQQFMSSIGR